MKAKALYTAMFVLGSMWAGLVGCTGGDHDMDSRSKPAKSLYERLGGEAAIAAVTEDFVGRAASNPAVNFTRRGTGQEWSATPENVEHLKKMLVQFLCMATGGPQKYEGRSMKSVHAGMKISSAEFDALAADLAASLDKFNVPRQEKDELMAIAASTKKDIVETP